MKGAPKGTGATFPEGGERLGQGGLVELRAMPALGPAVPHAAGVRPARLRAVTTKAATRGSWPPLLAGAAQESLAIGPTAA